MAQYFFRDPLIAGVQQGVIGKNSEAFAKADPVTIDANGFLTVSTAGDRVDGYCLEDKTCTSSNQTVAKYMPQYVDADKVLMVYTADQACTQTDIGAYADLTGTTGAIQMNLVAGTSGQFFVRAFDPNVDGTTTLVVVEVAEVQHSAAAQA